MANTLNPLIPFDALAVAKMYTTETAAGVRATERDDTYPPMDEIKSGQMAAALLYGLRTFLSPEDREALGKPPREIRPDEPRWLQDAHRNSIAVRLPEEKTATPEQQRAALKAIGEIADELQMSGYKTFAGVLRDYVSSAPSRPKTGIAADKPDP